MYPYKNINQNSNNNTSKIISRENCSTVYNNLSSSGLSSDDYETKTGLKPVGRIAQRSGMDRAERIANPLFEWEYQLFKIAVLEGLDPVEYLDVAKRPAWVSMLPGPLNDPSFIGDDEIVLKYWMEALFHDDQHMLVKQWSDKYSNNCGNFVVPAPKFGWEHKAQISYFLIVCNSDDHQRLTRDHVKKAPIYDGSSYGQSFLGHYDVKEWRQQRNHLMQPMLPLTIFSKMLPTMESSVNELISRIKLGEGATMFYGSTRPNQAFNIHELVLDTTFRILMRTLFGEDDDFIIENSQSIRWALQRPEISNKKARIIIKKWCQTLLKRAHNRVKKEDNKDYITKDGPIMKEMLGIPAMYKTKLPGHRGAEKQVLDNIAILSLAGHDTTGSTITFCLMELCGHPEWQEKCRNEIDTIFTQIIAEKRSITYKDFHKFKNLTKCINETLRIWNAVPYGSQRELIHDEFINGLNGKKILIPKGTMFLVPNFCQGRSKKLWGNDADEWNPTRWAGFAEKDSINFTSMTDVHNIPQFSARNPESPRFHPFTRGPRDCFGKNFAQAEIRIMLAHLLYNYKFDLAEPTLSQYLQNADQIAWQMAGILKPRDGLWMHITPRMQTAKL